MVLLELLEWVFLLLFVLFMVTQVVLPMWRETPYFPFFRRQARVLRIRKVLRILEDSDHIGKKGGDNTTSQTPSR
jgi:hypothetical protein